MCARSPTAIPAYDRTRRVRQPGATEGIAARIATRLADSGATVDLRRVDQVEALDAYDAVVFGAPVYDQSWPPKADRCVNGIATPSPLACSGSSARDRSAILSA